MAWPVRRLLRGRDPETGERIARWYVVIRDPRTGGQRTIPPSHGSLEEAEAAAARAAVEHEGRRGRPRRVTASTILPMFLAGLRAERLTADTVDHYEEYLRPMLAAWSGTPLARLSRVDFEAWVGQHPHWKASSVRKCANAARRLIGWAQDSGLDLPDFVGRFKVPKAVPTEAAPITLAELRRLLAASVGGPLEVAVHLAALAGLSRGDVRRLEWENVDLRGRWITRRRSKTGKPIRVRIMKQLGAVLARHRATSGPVARGLKTDSWLRKHLGLLYRAARVRSPRGGGYHSWHRLRHTLGTLAGEQTDTATVGRILAHGHGSASPAIYTHTDDPRVVAAMKAVEKALG